MASYPERLSIHPLPPAPLAAPQQVRVPGSKSITNRALVLAALTARHNPCRLRGALQSEDTEVMVDCLGKLGFDVEIDWPGQTIQVSRPSGSPLFPVSQADLLVGNSGTTMRFLTAMVALGRGTYRLDGVPRMRERPIADLLAALGQMGIEAASEQGNGCPPVVIEAAGLPGGNVKIRGDVSSQFLSGLLMAGPFAESDLSIDVEGTLVSLPYVDMTLAMMRQFGLKVDSHDQRRFIVPGRQAPEPVHTYQIEPDASAASYFFAAAAIANRNILVPGLRGQGLQGDVRFARVLEATGCTVAMEEDGICVAGGHLHGIDVDMNDISDTVMTLGAVACFAEGPTTIRNVAHIRHKETDRLAALATELRRVGATVDEFDDGLKITPGPLHGAEIETYDDHRMAMSLALVGLKVPGIVIKNPGCVAKTYPDFFRDLERLR